MSIVSFVERSDHLVVNWSRGGSARFHYVWLRDNCRCGECRHPTVGERLLISTDVPLDLHADAVAIGGGSELEIGWPDGHRSTYSADWLASYSYESGDRELPEPASGWPEGLLDDPPEVTYEAIMAGDAGVLTWLHQLRDYGVSFVRGAPTEPGTVGEVAQRIAFIRNSNFGLIWDVQSTPDPNSLAYTAHRLTPHTDLVSRETMPGLQFLHCLVFEASGGDSVLVDGLACAAELERTDPDAYGLLTTVALRFHYRDRATEISALAPMIRLDEFGRPAEIRYSNALLGPLEVPPELTMAVYRALHAFGALILSPRVRAALPSPARRRDVFRQLPRPPRPRSVRLQQRCPPPAGHLRRSRRLPLPPRRARTPVNARHRAPDAHSGSVDIPRGRRWGGTGGSATRRSPARSWAVRSGRAVRRKRRQRAPQSCSSAPRIAVLARPSIPFQRA